MTITEQGAAGAALPAHGLTEGEMAADVAAFVALLQPRLERIFAREIHRCAAELTGEGRLPPGRVGEATVCIAAIGAVLPAAAAYLTTLQDHAGQLLMPMLRALAERMVADALAAGSIRPS